MKQDHKRDMDCYVIEDDNGRKCIHYEAFSYIYEDVVDDDDLEWVKGKYPTAAIDNDTFFVRTHELTFCYVPVSEYSRERLDLEQGEVQQYIDLTPLELAEDFPGEYLPLREVNEDTPYGIYWCYLEDE